MTALSLRQVGFQRMGAGAIRFRHALVDAGRGLYAMLSGLGLFLAGVVLTPWMWFSWPFIRPAPGTPDAASRWRRLFASARRIARTGVRWVTIGLVWCGVIAALTFAMKGAEQALRETLPNASDIVYPIMIFTGLAVVYLAAFLAIRLGAALLAQLRRGLTPRGMQVLAVTAAVLLASATGAILYAVLKPTPIIALIAGVALLAGLAGFAIISFGPSGVALFNVGKWDRAAGRSAGRRRPTPSRSSTIRPAQPAMVMHQSVIGGSPQGAAAAAIGAPLASRERAVSSKPWSVPHLAIDRGGIILLLLAALVIALAWFGGEALLRVVSGNAQPGGAAVKPASPTPAPRENATPGTGVPGVVQLSADGEPAEISWQSGYRQLTARTDDGSAVRRLALPTTACGAAAIVAFGAASSDGSVARNESLAQRRALWLADWTRRELSQCPDAPAVIAVSLGQAKPGLPLPVQRAVRLLAIREEDVRNPAFSAGPQMLRDIAQASSKGLDAFTRFDACIVTAHKDDQPALGWLRPCAEPQQ
ncbi:MAG: hypothetical protein ABMA14_24820 [Hyphomonadaceae bacterium]